ncbi:MAG: DUF1667 domain-containing protein [Anaerolineaceae bacterium]|nr:MAG: DUF1667 domain-containing protein [Anaerolineaceae bacterium]
MDKQELTCISCPIGCHLEVTNTEQGYVIRGNQCKRGETYAISELTSPTRVLTSTIGVKGGFLNRLPVRTNSPIPKDKLFAVMEIINTVIVNAPIKAGDIILKNLLGTGVDLIASRSISE